MHARRLPRRIIMRQLTAEDADEHSFASAPRLCVRIRCMPRPQGRGQERATRRYRSAAPGGARRHRQPGAHRDRGRRTSRARRPLPRDGSRTPRRSRPGGRADQAGAFDELLADLGRGWRFPQPGNAQGLESRPHPRIDQRQATPRHGVAADPRRRHRLGQRRHRPTRHPDHGRLPGGGASRWGRGAVRLRRHRRRHEPRAAREHRRTGRGLRHRRWRRWEASV